MNTIDGTDERRLREQQRAAPLAAADPSTGRLLTPHLGNNGTDTVRTLYTSASNYLFPLPAGRYYWTVQAVDNGYAASAFAPAQSFAVGESGTVRTVPGSAPSAQASRRFRLRPGRQPGTTALDGRRAP